MAKVLRTHGIPSTQDSLVKMIGEEIVLLTRNVPCGECAEILIEKSLFDRADFRRLIFGDKILGFKYRVVHGPGVRPGSLAVITRTEILFK